MCSFSNVTLLNPTLTCADNGIFTVTLTVDDAVNPPVTSTAPVTVNSIAPTITGLAAGVAAACGQTNSLAISFHDPALARDTYTAVVNWGDGSSTTYSSVNTGFPASHVYAGAGQYTASVTVSDENGGASTVATAALVLKYAVVGGGVQQPINQDERACSIPKWHHSGQAEGGQLRRIDTKHADDQDRAHDDFRSDEALRSISRI